MFIDCLFVDEKTKILNSEFYLWHHFIRFLISILIFVMHSKSLFMWFAFFLYMLSFLFFFPVLNEFNSVLSPQKSKNVLKLRFLSVHTCFGPKIRIGTNIMENKKVGCLCVCLFQKISLTAGLDFPLHSSLLKVV